MSGAGAKMRGWLRLARQPTSRFMQQSYALLTEDIRFWVPKTPLQAQTGENLAHLARLRTPRILLQSGRIPDGRKRPELLYRYHRPHRITMRRAPIPDYFFRPEEEHVASGEYDVVPPLRSRDKAVKNPGRRFGLREAHCKAKWLSGLLAPGVNHTRSL